jgi:DNA (cytosine-5)-methyltransferase 1
VSLVLSLFPGIGLLDMAFEEEGFCVVRGPDLLWGGDIRKFHPPVGRFDGVIGGPPCQCFSPLVNVNKALGREPAANLIPEFERVVREALPAWFLMENVPAAPIPALPRWSRESVVLRDHWTGGETSRCRRFTFGASLDVASRFDPETLALHTPSPEFSVVASVGGRRMTANPTGRGHQKRTREGEGLSIAKDRPLHERARLQGLPAGFDIPPFRRDALSHAIGNGVPLAMGRTVARAVKEATGEGAAA